MPKEKIASLAFEADTIYFKIIAGENKIHQQLTATNNGNVALTVATVVASCNCTKVSYDKKRVLPGDSLQIDVIIRHKESKGAAVTVVGNLANGQKTVFIKFFQNKK